MELYLFAIAVPVLAIIIPLVMAYLQHLRNLNKAKKLEKDYPQALKIISGVKANGKVSKQFSTINGKGSLILLDNELRFESWSSDKLIQIPIHRIISAEAPEFYINQVRFRPALRLIFNNGIEQDFISFEVPNLDSLMPILEHDLQIGFTHANYA